MSDRIEFGALFPPERFREVGKLEECGYDSAWASEHILFYGPHLEAMPVLAAYAALTTRIALGTAVYLLPLRHATVTAKSVATVDILSGGRMILGVGVGGEYPKEFESTGVPVHERGRRANEAIPLLRRLWGEEHVSHPGPAYPLDDVTMEPRPPQAGALPIWVAGRSEAAMVRAGRLGDGWMPYLYTPQRYREGLARVRAEAEAAGRDPAAITPVLYQFIAMDDNREAALRAAIDGLSEQYNQPFDALAEKYCAVGTPADCAARLAEFIDAGARHVILVPVRPRDPVEAFADYARDLFPRLPGSR